MEVPFFFPGREGSVMALKKGNSYRVFLDGLGVIRDKRGESFIIVFSFAG